MKNIFLTVVFISTFLYSQSEIEVQVLPAIPTSHQIDWGIDNLLLNNEPAGGFSGVQKSDGTLYVAVNDTISTANLGLVVFVSTNGGDTWTMHPSGINIRSFYQKVKMFRSGLDSIYCSFQIGSQIFTWNPLSGNFGQFWNGNYRDFDVTASSTGNLYLFADSLPTNSIVRYGSTNGGRSWFSRGLVTSAGAHPKIFMSGSGDTLSLNYYGPVLADTATSIIRAARYRESGPGTMAVVGSFTNIASEVEHKREFKTIRNNGEVWFIYTLGADGSRNIMARQSIDNGINFSTAVPIAGNPNTDEYGFDGNYFTLAGSGGFDVIYFSDSAATANSGGANDFLYSITVDHGSSTFSQPQIISENPPSYSPKYSPTMFPMHFSLADIGALWVGDQGGNLKLFWDKLSAVIPVELTSFTASVSGNDVLLNWTTATELNNSGFAIEKSVDNEIFHQVSFVPGFGTTTENRNYSFTDNSVYAGTYYYRLKQIDYDGSYEYSEVAEVEIGVPEEFYLSQNYPNPFNPETKIEYSIAITTNVKLSIYNSIGEEIITLVNEIQQPGKYIINFSAGNLSDGKASLSSGIYFYKLIAGEFISVKKMILMK